MRFVGACALDELSHALRPQSPAVILRIEANGEGAVQAMSTVAPKADLRRTRAQLRKLLSSKDPSTVQYGCELLWSLASDPALRGLVEELAAGSTMASETGRMTVGDEIRRRVRPAHRMAVAFSAVGALGGLEGRSRLELCGCDTEDMLSNILLGRYAKRCKVGPWDPGSLSSLLGGVPALQSLHLDASEALLSGQLALPNVRRLDLRFCQSIRHLGGLEGLPALTHLSLHNCTELESLDFTGLSRLTHLSLYHCVSLKRLDGLQGLSGLRHLCLHHPQPSDLDGLQALPQLQSLTLRSYWPGNRSLKNVDALSQLTQLKRLELKSCFPAVRRLAFLKPLTQLVELDLSNSRDLHDVTALASLPKLERLTLNFCDQIRHLDVLEGLKQLEHLSVAQCHGLTQLDVLTRLPRLQSLNLGIRKHHPKHLRPRAPTAAFTSPAEVQAYIEKVGRASARRKSWRRRT